ncbi:MAG: YvrJ family protein [Bacillota bacterium]|nr:YvrJ family protein [Bacillota bacterium]
MEDLFTAAANVGFPMVLSVYLLVRVEGKIETLADSVHHLSQSITKLSGQKE